MYVLLVRVAVRPSVRSVPGPSPQVAYDAWVGLLPELRLRTHGGGPGAPPPHSPRAVEGSGGRVDASRTAESGRWPTRQIGVMVTTAGSVGGRRFWLPVPDLWRGGPGPGSRRPAQPAAYNGLIGQTPS